MQVQRYKFSSTYQHSSPKNKKNPLTAFMPFVPSTRGHSHINVHSELTNCHSRIALILS